METVILSLSQLNVLTENLIESGFARIVIENTNIENTIACSLDGKQFLVDAKGNKFDLVKRA